MPSSPVAVFMSDVHLSHVPPIARSVEPDWYAVMKRTLGQVEDIAQGVPVFIAGDLFHRWNSPPELINFAMKYLPPNCWAIPGQHDLPNHNHEEIKRSAYWSLVAGSKLNHLGSSSGFTDPSDNGYDFDLLVHPYPWQAPLTDIPKKKPQNFDVALCHRYCYTNNSNPAKMTNANFKPSHICKVFPNMDLAVFGDNHMPFFDQGLKAPNVLNCGGLFRRNSNEVVHKPSVWVLDTDKEITRRKLDCSDDKFLDPDDVVEAIKAGLTSKDMEEWMSELQEMNDKSVIDFSEIVQHALTRSDFGKDVCRIILKVLQEVK